MIDCHCHLDLYPHPRDIASGCLLRQMHVLSVTNTPSAWHGTSQLAMGAAAIHTALGLHPQLAKERRSELPLFDKLLPQTSFVGEVGLDGAPENTRFQDDQLHVFRHIIQRCRMSGRKVLSVHSRRATTAVLDELSPIGDSCICILHWFSGSATELERASKLGCWFSVGPTMLESKRGASLVARMPRERVLTETDGPFAQVKGKAVQPWDVQAAIPQIASSWASSPEDVESIVRSNFERLMRFVA